MVVVGGGGGGGASKKIRYDINCEPRNTTYKHVY